MNDILPIAADFVEKKLFNEIMRILHSVLNYRHDMRKHKHFKAKWW